MLEESAIANLAALATPLPPVPEDEVFTPGQWTSFIAISEVFIPDLTQCINGAASATAIARIRQVLPASTDDSIIAKYLAETVVNNPEFKEAARQRFAGYVPKAQAKGLAFLLSALNTRVGSLAMTGSTTSFHARDIGERSKIVLGWADSYIGPLRALYGGIEAIAKAIWVAQSTTLHQVLDYPKVPKNIERHPGYDFQFIDFADTAADSVLELTVDVVIIGSGCGAGVVAEYLATSTAGVTPKPWILVLEKGYHFPSSHFPMDQAAAGVNIQEGGGAVMSDDGSIAVLAGATFGGGGTINWSASLQPHRKVRQEWASKVGLPFLVSEYFQDCLDEVCDKMGVCRANDLEGLSKIEHNFGNKALLEASRRLGYHASTVPQNTAGKRHYCGRCGLGCASATKQGPANFWLPAAADKGVDFIEGCFVDEIIWDDNGPPKSATGIRATWTSRDRSVTRKLKIFAKKIVVSSGTLHSPLLLHRSGLTPEANKHIGSNLHLHPTMTVRGTYSGRVDPWDGSILTAVMTSLEDLDGKGHGPKIEILLGTPDLTGSLLPSRPQLSTRAIASAKGKGYSTSEAALTTALDYRVRIARHGHSFTYIVIQRDHADPANSQKCYVYQDPDDSRKVKINYTPSLADRTYLVEGAVASARMHYVMGAETIEVCSPLLESFERSMAVPAGSSIDDEFERWITSIKNFGAALLDTRRTRLGSAHQMGTCRMSGSPTDGVVDSMGKVWNTENVYVADASILPSASGVNPMVSTMALSLHVAKNVAKAMGVL